ncbi:hypothetical protein GCM10009839_74370 [Catenulispora yoronensis]|uniref:Uncharacterized protein n=1 Tax=Catenulispora yoronensis TaxID=450799 RepID=A0ABP5GRG1_9ACTN
MPRRSVDLPFADRAGPADPKPKPRNRNRNRNRNPIRLPQDSDSARTSGPSRRTASSTSAAEGADT